MIPNEKETITLQPFQQRLLVVYSAVERAMARTAILEDEVSDSENPTEAELRKQRHRGCEILGEFINAVADCYMNSPEAEDVGGMENLLVSDIELVKQGLVVTKIKVNRGKIVERLSRETWKDVEPEPPKKKESDLPTKG